MRKYAICTDENPSKAMRALWKNDGTTEVFQWGAGSTNPLCPPEVLQSFLRRCEELYSQKYISQKSKKATKGELRIMPRQKKSTGASCGSKPIEQPDGKYPNALSHLSQFLAQDCAAKWKRDRGTYASNRVDRVKCLGNSVVPLQVREAFKRLCGLK